MSFKFDFQIDEEDDDQVVIPQTSTRVAPAEPSSSLPSTSAGEKKCHRVALDELIKTLPEAISYSPLFHPSLTTPLLRRDLFDARFQLINRDEPQTEGDAPLEVKEAEGEEYVDAQTDLIPGLYEGGLKTWEGGVDLVEVLGAVGVGKEAEDKALADWVRGGSVLEVGCGTAIPTAYLLRSLLSQPPTSSTETTFHLQDYNSIVLSLVTLPNLILAALPFLPAEVLHQPEEGDELIESVVPDLEEPGHIGLTAKLVEAFKVLLEERGVKLLFTYGHWEGLGEELKAKGGGEGYGLVLTAETIYQEDSTPALIEVLRAGVKKGGKVSSKEVRLEDSIGELSVKDDWTKKPLREAGEGFVLVAAKVLYFGVGGGLQGFLEQVESNGGHYSTIKEWLKGVGRKVVQVGW
ncbi:hypothetical protein IAT38_008117 [Cryptococcus sp. DSM 104549]